MVLTEASKVISFERSVVTSEETSPVRIILTGVCNLLVVAEFPV